MTSAFVNKVSDYFRIKRLNSYEKHKALKGVKVRHNRRYHNILLALVKADRKMNKENLCVLSDNRVPTTRPIIYACTHYGGNDIQRVFEAIKAPAYLFWGNPGKLYLSAAGLLLWLNGVICVATNDKKDRKISRFRSEEILNRGGNVLIFPEGAWNITDNLPVMKLFRGAAAMAVTTKADIIPIAVEKYEDTYYVSIGKNIDCSNKSDDDVGELNAYLRDKLCELKWELWDSQPIFHRKDISENELTDFAEYIVNECKYDYTVQDVYDTWFVDKTITTREQAFEHLKRIEPSVKTAFLFNKHRSE